MNEPGRLEQILAILLIQSMKGSSQQEKIVELRRAGFTNVEIADLLGTSASVVAQSHYEASKGKKKTARKGASKR